ncbi:solute carrier family 35 protein [Actinidia rufa]|uniref:Solute carrier family 35 protein n=1 Tax=Actinidia rufa TaxID=165716 RepID=A0A7J0GD61_9ERIC|nr:solute carrier family 35 protein [Actinidia rufa]
MNISRWKENGALLRILYVLFLGQVVSFVMSLMSFAASLTANLGVDTPLTLSFFSYLALALVYGSILLYRRQKLLVPWYWYVVLGFVDVQGNYLVNKAFQYSSITSVTLLDCWTIAWVILLTWFLLGTRYSLWQFFGAALCVLGLGLVLISDAGVGGGGGSKPLLGDILVIAGTLFFAMSNVGEEFCVKMKDRVEVVAMIGLFGTLSYIGEEESGISYVVGRNSLPRMRKQYGMETMYSISHGTVGVGFFGLLTWYGRGRIFANDPRLGLIDPDRGTAPKYQSLILAFAGYAVSSFMFYTLVPFVLKMSGATMFNLSVLTSDMWAVVVRIFFYRQQVLFYYKLELDLLNFVDWLYYVSFAIVVVGLVIYSKTEKKDSVAEPAIEDGNLNAPYQVLGEESEESRNGTIAS